jgi:methylenetetrahydrofolate dehydrogenase (NADP+) / methenyltetrahydrofolate cyclohydrolase
MAAIIDGKMIAAELRDEVAGKVRELASGWRLPRLVVVRVGDDPASASYVRGKTKAAADVGIVAEDRHLDAEATETEVVALVRELGSDELVDAILVQLPLPSGIDEMRVIEAIPPHKDVDGFHPINAGLLLLGRPRFVPCTPAGIVHLLQAQGVVLRGRRVVIVGRSNIVGKPLALLLGAKGVDATVTCAHSRTESLADVTRTADVLIAAVGRARLITVDMVKPGAVVVDVGVNRVADASRKRGYRLVGDVDFDGVAPVVSAITPVPGGVGPLTIAMLLRNTLDAATLHRGRP